MLAVTNICELPAPPADVWPYYTSAAEWPKWSADIASAELEGEFKEGACGRCTYRGLPAGRFTVDALEPERSFTVSWSVLATTVRFEHELAAVRDHGTHVVERISFHGLLALPLGLLERPRIRTDWPRSMDALGMLALESWRARKPASPRNLDPAGTSRTPLS